jgi:hypothetical protein
MNLTLSAKLNQADGHVAPSKTDRHANPRSPPDASTRTDIKPTRIPRSAFYVPVAPDSTWWSRVAAVTEKGSARSKRGQELAFLSPTVPEIESYHRAAVEGSAHKGILPRERQRAETCDDQRNPRGRPHHRRAPQRPRSRDPRGWSRGSGSHPAISADHAAMVSTIAPSPQIGSTNIMTTRPTSDTTTTVQTRKAAKVLMGSAPWSVGCVTPRLSCRGRVQGLCNSDHQDGGHGQLQPLVMRRLRRGCRVSCTTGLLLLLWRLGVEKVVHHRDDDGHALHQRDVGGVGQDG